MDTDAEKAMRSIRPRFPKRLVLAVAVVVETPRDEIDPVPLSRSGDEMRALLGSMELCLGVDAALHEARRGPRK